jgi:hypothetical protein
MMTRTPFDELHPRRAVRDLENGKDVARARVEEDVHVRTRMDR